MNTFFRKNWFMLGLILVPLVTIADITGFTVMPGQWLKSHHGPDIVIGLIFLLSGLALNIGQLREGVADIKGTLLALLLIFAVAPLLAYPITIVPLQAGISLGLLLVATMPTTLSSGVVMTGSAGGNMAHALFITVVANSLALFTIPITLEILLGAHTQAESIVIDQAAIMTKLATRVLLPLFLGIFIRSQFGLLVKPLLPYTGYCNQLGILIMVWMAVCAGRQEIVNNFASIFTVLLVVCIFHGLLVSAALLFTSLLRIAKGKRESVIFMGGQKTLPLSVILQVSLFPEYGIALVVCVIHHIVHLIMDAYLIGYLKRRK